MIHTVMVGLACLAIVLGFLVVAIVMVARRRAAQHYRDMLDRMGEKLKWRKK